MNITPPPPFSIDMIVFTHLRWQFVTQRPQHLMQRFAQNGHILVVEEPIIRGDGNSTHVIFSPLPSLTVIQPRFTWDEITEQLPLVIDSLSQKLHMSPPLLWFYTPLFADVIPEIDHCGVVYDCMDELSQFKDAPSSLLEKEDRLLQFADVVFTGGRSLYEAKSKKHPAVFCFPSSVDIEHFQRPDRPNRSELWPADMAQISSPIIGFYGVIDERIDLELLAEVARLMPHVSFVMIGPVVKIDPKTLPKAPNLFWLGAKEYDVLPNYLYSFDITMMPFALNKATQFISPTKTLEFMAAKKPIISTPIVDVERNYKNEVKIVHSAQDFAAAIIEFLQETPTEKKFREELQERVVLDTSWDSTVEGMKRCIAKYIHKDL